MDGVLCQGALVQIAASMMSFTVSCSLMEFNKYSLAVCSVIDSVTFIFYQPCRIPQPLQKISKICQRLTVRSFGDSLGEEKRGKQYLLSPCLIFTVRRKKSYMVLWKSNVPYVTH